MEKHLIAAATSKDASHVQELQSFRGLAALVVLVHHCLFYYTYSRTKFVEVLFNAHAAVVSFYVLSGFVLALSLSKSALTRRSIAEFYARRLFRIYPALWVACMLGVVYIVAFRNTPLPISAEGWWPTKFRDDDISWSRVALYFLGFGDELPVAMWSIRLELIGSALMPAIIYAQRRVVLNCMLGGILTCLCFFGQSAMTVYLICFMLGASIVQWESIFRRAISGRWLTAIAAIVSGAALALGRQIGGWDYEHDYHAGAPIFIEAASATVLIALIYTKKSSFSALRHKLLTKLGDISYSLYLVHLPILGLVAGLGEEVLALKAFVGHPALATTMLFISTLAISLALATLLFHTVELPFMSLGKAAIQRFRQRARINPSDARNPSTDQYIADTASRAPASTNNRAKL